MLTVGVLTMPGSDTLGPEPVSYLLYDNYKWLKRAGLRVIPIPVGTSDDEALVYFRQLQGLYLAGGPYDEPTYRRLAFRFLDLASEADRPFPVWGTCHGFQMMLLWAGVPSLDPLDAMRRTTPTLSLQKDRGRLFKSHTLQAKHLHVSHSLGLTLDHFQKNRRLKSLFRVLATSHDRDGVEYVSAIEGLVLPWYGVQFHPEMTTALDWMGDFFKKEMQVQQKPPALSQALPHTFSLTLNHLRPCPPIWDEYHTEPTRCFVFCGKSR